MAKLLRKIIPNQSGYAPTAKGEKNFVDLHKVDVTAGHDADADDKVYKASNIKKAEYKRANEGTESYANTDISDEDLEEYDWEERDDDFSEDDESPETDNAGNSEEISEDEENETLHQAIIENKEALEEARKNTNAATNAFLSKGRYKNKNDHVENGEWRYHGNKIAWHIDDGEIHASHAGWGTTTTRERLHNLSMSLTGKPIYQHKHQLHHGDEPISSRDTIVLKRKKVNEDEINEISRKTLGSYIKKASHDAAVHSAATGRYAERANKEKEIRNKTGDSSGYFQARKDDAFANKTFEKSWKRRMGIAKAVDKLTKEETQNLDEMMTRKHFKEVANTVRSIEDPKKRQEFADHHAAIFHKDNPRFDHSRFHDACGTKTKAARGITE